MSDSTTVSSSSNLAFWILSFFLAFRVFVSVFCDIIWNFELEVKIMVFMLCVELNLGFKLGNCDRKGTKFNFILLGI